MSRKMYDSVMTCSPSTLPSPFSSPTLVSRLGRTTRRSYCDPSLVRFRCQQSCSCAGLLNTFGENEELLRHQHRMQPLVSAFRNAGGTDKKSSFSRLAFVMPLTTEPKTLWSGSSVMPG